MVINIIDREFNFIGQIDQYESFIAPKKYNGIGHFELHLSSIALYANDLVEENIIFTDERKAYIILYRKRDSKDNKVVIRGVELKSYLSRMIIFPPTGSAYFRINSNAETIMKEYVSSQLARKNITNIEVALNKNRGTSFVYQSRYKNLADELEKISLASGLGWDVTLDLDNKKFVFDVVEGRDITVNQDVLPPAIFSVDYDNVEEQTLEESKMDYANVAIVAGQGEGVDREIYVSGDTEGLDNIELFVDARDLEKASDLPDRGIQKLKEVEKTLVFDSKVLTDKNLIYEEDYKLGDIATIQNADWDITVDRRITEVAEIYEENGFRLDVTFGEGLPTLSEKIKQATDQPISEDRQGEPGTPGQSGKDGYSIEYDWKGTELGIKREDEAIFGYTNLRGEQGVQGPQGLQGPKGDTGTRGPEGTQGKQGIKGDTGERGPQGVQGLKGDKGDPFVYTDFTPTQIEGLKVKGDTGARGPQGLKGDTGLTGAKGDKGDPFIYSDFTPTQLNGLKIKGDKGDVGPQGPIGKTGPQGKQGIKGDVGPKGNTGLKGDKGNDGYTPIKNIDYFDGAKGDKGEQGIQGPKGDKGDKGDVGAKGIQGLPGLNGKSIEYIWNGTKLGLRIEGEIVYQYVDLKGEKGDTGLQGERGLQGLKGDTGLTGATGKSIQYLWNGTQLGIRVEGESVYQYVNLKGDTGPKGNDGYTPIKGKDYFDGEKGEKGDTGARGIQGLKGDKGDAFTYSDFTQPQLLGLKGDKGDTGPRGPQGIQGPKGDAIADSVEWNKVLNKPNTFKPSSHTQDWDTITQKPSIIEVKTQSFYVDGDADTFYPVVFSSITGSTFFGGQLTHVYRRYNDIAPPWYSSTHKGGLNVKLENYLAGWGGVICYMDIMFSQTYAQVIADIQVAGPDTNTIIMWLRGGHAKYHLETTAPSVRINPVIGTFVHKEGTQYERSYPVKTSAEKLFVRNSRRNKIFGGINLYAGSTYNNPSTAKEVFHGGNFDPEDTQKIITSKTEPSNLNPDDQWHKEY